MKTVVTAVALFMLVGFAAPALAFEFSGNVALEGTAFFYDPLYDEQERHAGSISAQPEFYHEFKNGSSLIFVPFARLDGADEERSHYDIRELNYLHLADGWEARIGVGKVFWGVTEFVHLVDIINQTDFVESINGEEKLGQPMIHLSIPGSFGVVDFFALLYFRERTFPGEKGRLRFPLVVDTDSAKYESDDEERHVDFAIRYSQSIGDWDIGLSHFYGTGREPAFNVEINSQGAPVIVPYYQLINQSGLDLQLVAGDWLLKLEAIYQSAQSDDYYAVTGGFEYTFVGIFESGLDLGVVGEWIYDDRGDEASTSFENDAVIGLRLTLNDAASTDFLAALVQDADTSSRAISVEASRRLWSSVKASIEAWSFFDLPEDDLLYGLRDEDYIKLKLAYYY